MKSIFKYLIGLSLLSCGSCYYDSEEALYGLNNVDCSKVAATYTVNVQPIINAKCATSGCHNESAAGGVILLTYDNCKTHAARIKVRTVTEKTMPPGGGMTQGQLNIINCWVTSSTPQ